MLKKLLKYDLKSILKFLIIFYGLAIFFGLLTRLFFNFDNSFMLTLIAKILSGTAISMMVSSLINNVMRLWVRFTNNFYKDESYLTHTLPVNKRTLYTSKILCSVITFFVTALVIFLTIFVAYYSKENIEILKNFLDPIIKGLNINVVRVVVSFVIIIFLEILNMLQAGYTGIILGHKFNSNKIGFSVLFGFITYIALQIISFVSLYFVALFNKDFMSLFTSTNTITYETFNLIILVSSIIYFALFIVNYIINIKLFEKGVNVE